MQHQSKQVDLNALMLLLVSEFAKGFLVKKSFWVSVMLTLLAAGGTASACDYEGDILDYMAKQTGQAKYCFSVSSEQVNHSEAEFTVREVHNIQCGGDPQTSPVVARFNANVKACRLLVFDVVDGEFRDLNN